MSFRFGKNESPGEAARRIFLEELDAIRAELLAAAENAGALHEVRKRIKKLRALVYLVRAVLGDSTREEDRTLRDVGRLLARHREVDAVDALLLQEARAAGSADIEDLRAAVRLHQIAGDGWGDRARDLETARRAMGAMRRRVATVVFSELTRRECRRRLRKAYQRARNAYRAARDNQTEESLHQWRKAAKALLNQTRLLGAWGGAGLSQYRQRLVRLDDGLGRGRDCAFLALILRGVPAAETPLRYGLGLRARLETAARDDVTRAWRLGGKLFRRSPREFVQRLLE